MKEKLNLYMEHRERFKAISPETQERIKALFKDQADAYRLEPAEWARLDSIMKALEEKDKEVFSDFMDEVRNL